MFAIRSRMADTTARTTLDIARLHWQLMIRCRKCGHKLLADGEKLATMFPQTIGLDIMRYRMRCKACGERWPVVEVIRKPPR